MAEMLIHQDSLKYGYELNSDVVKDLRKSLDKINSDYTTHNNYEHDISNFINNIESSLNQSGEKRFLNSLKDDIALKYMYLKENNIDFKIQEKAKEYRGRYNKNIIYDLLNNHIEDVRKFSEDHQSESISDNLKDIITNLWAKENNLQDDEKAKELYKDRLYFSTLDNMAMDVLRLQRDKDAGITTEIDYSATDSNIKEATNQEDFEKWLDKKFGNLINRKGLRNNKDYYTPSGNIRSFNQLYDGYTLENAVRLMLQNNDTGSESDFSYGVSEIAGNVSKRYKSLEDIKNDESLIREMGDEEFANITDDLQDRITKVAEDIRARESHFDNPFIELDNIESVVGNIARDIGNGKKPTIDLVKKHYKEYSYNTITDSEANEILDVIESLKELPTRYFEAKPQRAVGLDEIKAMVIPNNMDSDLRKQLEDRNIRLIEYDPNIAGDREAKLKGAELDDLRFSKDTTGDWENYLTKYAKGTTQTFLPGLKGVMPEKKYTIKDYEDVLKEYQFTDEDKQDLLADLQGIKLNKQSLDEFKDFVRQFDENYQESMAMKQDQKEIENNILNTKQTFNTGRKEIYNKYKNDNSKYDKTFINQAKQAIPGNRYGRTKDQWLYVAKTLGNYMANANLTDEQIEKITYRTWLDEAPNQKSNLNRQGEKFVKFNSDDWINAVYNEVNNLRKFSIDASEDNEISNENNIAEDQVKRDSDIVLNNGRFQVRNNTNSKEDIEKYLKTPDNDLTDAFRDKFDYALQRSEAMAEAYNEVDEIIQKSNKNDLWDNLIQAYEDISKEEAKLDHGEYADNNGKAEMLSIKLHSKETYLSGLIRTLEKGKTINDNLMYNELHNNTEKINQLPQGETLKLSQETAEKQAPEEEIKLPKKTMNPAEISNLKYEDVTTTPNLPEKKYAKGEKTSSFVSNVYNDVEFLNDLQKQDITQDENVRYYKEVTNKKDLENAYKDLQENGQRATLQWYAKNPSESTSEDVAKGWILFKQYADKGDTKDLVNVARKLRAMGTNGGQVVQAFNILSRLTPEGMVYYAQSELDDAYNEMIKGKSKAWIDQHKADFDLTPEEVAFIMDTMQNLPAENLATHNYERKVALGQIQKLFTDKLPVEKGKIKAWMRISMLFNPKTQVRNVMGNSVVVPVNMFSDFLGSKVDKLLSKYTGVRTLGNTNIKNYLGGMKEGFYQSYNDYKLGINTRDIEQNRFEFGQGKAFKDTGLGKQINRIDNMLNFVMDFGDRGFYQGSFVNSLNNQMLLNGVDTPTQDMIDIATQEALSRTWNDSNDYTRFVLNLRSGLNKLIGGENYGLGDVLIPFAKTPANLTKAIVEYSPVGLAKSIMDIKGIKNAIETGQFTAQQQHEFVDHLGKGLAGSLLYVISYALAKAGVASGEPDDDKDLKNFMRYSLGVTPYSITIGNKSFTYDWMQPIATPLAIMSNLEQYEKNNPDASAIEKVLSSVNIGTNQLLEQSFMQSINEVLNGNGEFTDRLSKAVLDLPARAIPTFSKQIADLVDDTQRTTFERGKPVQSAVNAVIAKIPGASKTLTPAVDTLGHDIKKYGGDNNFFNVFFNPANMNKGQETKAGKEIYDVYMKTGDTTVFPVTAPYYVDRKEGRINMDAETRAKYQRVAGKYTEEAVNKLLSDSSYKALSPDDKAEILSKVVTDSSEKAKKDVLNIDKNGSDLKLIEKVGTDYYTYKISTKDMSKDAEQCDVLLNKNYSNKNKQLIYESEINKEDKTFNGLKNIDSNFDMDEYLKYKTQTFSGDNRKENMVTYINDLNLSRAEQLYIKGRNYKLSNSEKYELESLLEDNPNLEEILDTIK